MPQMTACGLSFGHELVIPNVGTFRLGDDDYEDSYESGSANISVKAGRNVTSFGSKVRAWTVTLYDQPASILNSLKNQIRADFSSYRTTGIGSITVGFGGETLTGCYIQPNSIEKSPSTFDYEGVERFRTLSFKIIYPDPTLYG